MPRPRFNTLEPERRRAILAAAAEEFVEAGIDGASYNRVIARTGSSKGAMYYYFDDKQDLLRTVLVDAVERAAVGIGGVGAYADAAEFWAEILKLCERCLEFLRREPVLAGLAKRMLAAGSGAFAEALAEVARPIGEVTERLLRGGQAVGAVRSDVPIDLLVHLAMAVGEAVDRWLLAQWEGMSPQELARVPGHIVDLFKRLAAPAEAPVKRKAGGKRT
ncbi:MAG: TetR/AcrR family transcriptional regulator [Myxococcales bacterium]|nr:TetR/AcrR family transcriptional regulator [Myxococcales bacterium]